MALSESRSWCQCVFVLCEQGPRLTSVFGLALEAGDEGSACSHTDVLCGVRGDHSSGSCYRGFSHALLIYVCNGSKAPESEHILSLHPSTHSYSHLTLLLHTHFYSIAPQYHLFLFMSFHNIWGPILLSGTEFM